ncbi:ECF sigma factor [Sulfidibacter corallicola]
MGKPGALDALFDAVYFDLKKQAGHLHRNFWKGTYSARTISPTSIVAEFYLQLLKKDKFKESWSNTREFFGLVQVAMLRIILNYRRKQAKRPEGNRLSLEEWEQFNGGTETCFDLDYLAIKEALGDLKRVDADLYRVVDLRLQNHSFREIASLVGCGTATAQARLKKAMTWLRTKLAEVPNHVV